MSKQGRFRWGEGAGDRPLLLSESNQVCGQPERSYHLSELRRLTELGSASLQRELNRLADAGLILSERVGNLRRFQANPQSPVYQELLALTRKSLGAAPLLQEALQPIADQLENQLGRKITPNCYTPMEYSKRLGEPDSFINHVLAQPILPLIES